VKLRRLIQIQDHCDTPDNWTYKGVQQIARFRTFTDDGVERMR
jgi:hypothetical protein